MAKKRKKHGPMPSEAAMEHAGHELKESEPAAVKEQRRKKGGAAAAKMLKAIMFSKARRGK